MFVEVAEGNCNARYHFLETLEGGLDIRTGGDIVFDFVYEWRIGYSARVGWGPVFSRASMSLL